MSPCYRLLFSQPNCEDNIYIYRCRRCPLRPSQHKWTTALASKRKTSVSLPFQSNALKDPTRSSPTKSYPGEVARNSWSLVATCYVPDSVLDGCLRGRERISILYFARIPTNSGCVGWRPSATSADDGYNGQWKSSIDARIIETGQLVYIKKVETGDDGSRLATILWEQPLRNDPANPCVPILDSFIDDEDPSISYIVMPYLHCFDDPRRPVIVDDFVDLADQVLQVSVAMPSWGVH